MNVSLGVAIIGGAIGMAIGHRLMHIDRSAPTVFGLVFGIIFYMAATFILTVAIVAAVLLLSFVGLRTLIESRRTIQTFARNAGLSLAQRQQSSYSERLKLLQSEHAERVAGIESLGLYQDIQEQLLEREETRYKDRLIDLCDSDDS